MGKQAGAVADLIYGAIDGRLSRRQILQCGAALGVSATMIAAMIEVSERGASAAPSGDEVVIGCPYNLTGGYASIDNPAKAGSELAAKLLNAGNGILGRPVLLVIDDGRSDLTGVTNITKKMIDEDKVVSLVGLTDTDYMRAGGSIAQEKGNPFIDVGGRAPIIESIGDYILMLPFNDNVQAAAGAELAREMGWKSCAVLFDKAMTYTQFLAKYFTDRFTDDEIQGSVLTELQYSMGDTDFTAQLTEIKNLNAAPDFLYVSSNPGEIGTIITQERDLGIEQPILGGDAYDTPQLLELAGDAARSVYFTFTTHHGVYGDAPEAAAFKDAYKAEYGNVPESVFAALGFDGINLMADAINRAGETAGDKVRDALAVTSGCKGATGDISYLAPSRIPAKSVALVEVKDGAFSLIKIVVPRVVPAA